MEKNIISSGKMTFKFIWHFILYSLILSIITGFIYSILYSKINVIVMNIIELILSGVSIFIATKLSLKDIFSENELDEKNTKKYKRNIIIFFSLCIFLVLFYYALVYAISVLKIDNIAATLVISNNEDISGVIEQAKNIQLGITCALASVNSLVYIGMMKYQDTYIKNKQKRES